MTEDSEYCDNCGNKNGKEPIGIVTDEDILSKVSDVTVYAETTSLKDIMSTPLITVHENARLQEALHFHGKLVRALVFALHPGRNAEIRHAGRPSSTTGIGR